MLSGIAKATACGHRSPVSTEPDPRPCGRVGAGRVKSTSFPFDFVCGQVESFRRSCEPEGSKRGSSPRGTGCDELRAAQGMVKRLEGPQSSTRLEALEELGQLCEVFPEAASCSAAAVLARLEDHDPKVRAAAVKTLGRMCEVGAHVDLDCIIEMLARDIAKMTSNQNEVSLELTLGLPIAKWPRRRDGFVNELSRRFNATQVTVQACEACVDDAAATKPVNSSSRPTSPSEGARPGSPDSSGSASTSPVSSPGSPDVILSPEQKAVRIKKLLDVFELFDLDGTGVIESAELQKLGQARRHLGHKSGEWTAEKNARLIKKMDLNGDGTIRSDEFSEFFEQALSTDTDEFDKTMAQFTEVAHAIRKEKQKRQRVLVQAFIHDVFKSTALLRST